MSDNTSENGKSERDHYVVKCDTFWCAAYKADDGKWREVGTDKELTVTKMASRLEDSAA
jgi:hypothetical protein